MRTTVLDVEPEVGQQKQHDQAQPMVERNRDGRQSDLVHGRGDDAEDQATRRRLGEEVADRHADRDPSVFPWIRSPPVPDERCLDQRRDQENWQENQYDGACGLAQQFVEADVEFHDLLPSSQEDRSRSDCDTKRMPVCCRPTYPITRGRIGLSGIEARVDFPAISFGVSPRLAGGGKRVRTFGLGAEF